MQLSELGAELAALQTAATEKAVNRVAKLEVEAAKLALMSEKKKLDVAVSRMKRAETLYKQGLAQNSTFEDVKAEVEELEVAVQLAELNVQKKMVETEVVPGLSEELREVSVMRDQLRTQLDEMSAGPGQFGELKGMLLRQQAKVMESQMFHKRLGEMREQLEQLELEKRYLLRVLERYGKALATEDVAGDEEK